MCWKTKTLIFAGLLWLLFLFPQTVYATQTQQPTNEIVSEPLLVYEDMLVYYYQWSEDDTPYFASETFGLYGNFTLEQKAFILFSNFFEPLEKGSIPFVPENTRLLDVYCKESTLYINVSEEIKNSGGSMSEFSLIAQIIENAKQLEGIGYVTLLINGQMEYLPEGLGMIEYAIF